MSDVLAAMQEGVVVQAGDGAIVACNAAAERILGLTQSQLRGLTSMDPRWRSIHEDGSPFPGEAHPAMTTLRTGVGATAVVMGVHKPDGSLAWLSINTAPVFQVGRALPDAVVVTFTDITARRAAEARLQGMLRDRDQLVADLREALENVKRLSGLLPVCAWCKSVRNDAGYWQQIEHYLTEHTDARFTHGLCPDCTGKVAPS